MARAWTPLRDAGASGFQHRRPGRRPAGGVKRSSDQSDGRGQEKLPLPQRQLADKGGETDRNDDDGDDGDSRPPLKIQGAGAPQPWPTCLRSYAVAQVCTHTHTCMGVSFCMCVTARGALEHRIGCRLPNDHVIITWLVRHSPNVHNRYHVGNDGRTPWERVACRRSERPVTEFEEKAMLMTKAPKKDNTWTFGALLGLVA